MNSKSVIRVLVADPHPVVREGLAAMISRQPNMALVGQASSYEEMLCHLSELHPDVLVSENFLDGDGRSRFSKLDANFRSACILVLTAQRGDEVIYQALHGGATGYFFKDSPAEAITEAIRTIYSGRKALAQPVATQLANRLHSAELTRRELEVLLRMAQGRSNQEIGRSLFISEGTVKAHANNIYVKLNVSDRTQAVVLAIKRGLVPAPWDARLTANHIRE